METKISSVRPAAALPVMPRGAKKASPAQASAFAGSAIVLPSGSVCAAPCPDDDVAASKSSAVCAARRASASEKRLPLYNEEGAPRTRCRIAP